MDVEKAKLRRCEEDLRVCGMGVLALGAWTIIKLVLQLVGREDLLQELVGDEELAPYALGVLGVLALGLLLLHLFVSLNAVRAARGRKHRRGYAACAAFLAALTTVSLLLYPEEIAKRPAEVDSILAAILVDLTSIYVFWMIAVSTRRLKKLKAEQGEP